MGGKHQSVVPAPPGTAKVPDVIKATASDIRSHEEKGEIHFHDDSAGLKCAIKTPIFVDQYAKWRNGGLDGTLSVFGSDGKGGRASAHFHAFPDDKGKLQVAISVKEVQLGQTITDLDFLAGY